MRGFVSFTSKGGRGFRLDLLPAFAHFPRRAVVSLWGPRLDRRHVNRDVLGGRVRVELGCPF